MLTDIHIINFFKRSELQNLPYDFSIIDDFVATAKSAGPPPGAEGGMPGGMPPGMGGMPDMGGMGGMGM